MTYDYRKVYHLYRCPYCGELYESTEEEVDMFETYECPRCDSEVDYYFSKVKEEMNDY